MTDSDKQKMVEVTFEPEGRTARIAAGRTLREAAIAAGVALYAPCGGEGRCGKCRVRWLSGNAPEPTQEERQHISETELNDGVRLACCACMSRDVRVEVLAASGKDEIGYILTHDGGYTGEFEWDPVAVVAPIPTYADTDNAPGSDSETVLAGTGPNSGIHRDISFLRDVPDTFRSEHVRGTVFYGDDPIGFAHHGAPVCGAAFDIGTTTVAGWLYDIENGRELAVAAALNSQADYGADPVSRIQFASAQPDGLDVLHRAIMDVLNGLIQTMCRAAQVDPSSIVDCVVVGNTTMMHLFLGLTPRYLGLAPYVPVTRGPVITTGEKLGLKASRMCRIHHLPCIGSFVGADTVAVIMAAGLHRRAGTHLAIDIGTNGEIVLAVDGRLLACSTAAGPAFEGGEIACGMRGSPGAIDRVSSGDNGLEIHTIAGKPARGLCGSGVLDAVAALLQRGILNPTGRIVPEQIPPGIVSLEHDGQPGILLARTDTHEVYLTQRDVRHVQLAKGAIRVGIETLMDIASVTMDDVDTVYLAGAFGNYMRADSALQIGLVPAFPIDRFRPIGNAAGTGARLALLSRKFRAVADDIAATTKHVDLMTRTDFQARFAEAMLFPEPDPT